MTVTHFVCLFTLVFLGDFRSSPNRPTSLTSVYLQSHFLMDQLVILAIIWMLFPLLVFLCFSNLRFFSSCHVIHFFVLLVHESCIWEIIRSSQLKTIAWTGPTSLPQCLGKTLGPAPCSKNQERKLFPSDAQLHRWDSTFSFPDAADFHWAYFTWGNFC